MKAILAVLLCCMAGTAGAAERSSTVLDSGWEVRIDPRDTAAVRAHPKAARWFPAHVPGSVQQDLIASRQVPDPFIGTNEGAIQWAGLTDWVYRTTIRADAALLARGHVDMVFDGLDTFATVSVNGVDLARPDNAHRRWRVPVKAVMKPGMNRLEIAFRSPIKALQPMVLALKNPLPGEYDSMFGDEPEGRQTSPYIRKPKYHYGWDWGPRIVTIGPWRAVRIEAWDDARIATLRVTQEAITQAEARLAAELEVTADHDGPARVDVAVRGPDGTTVATRTVTIAAGASRVTVPVTIANPRLWFPAGYGAQPLYHVTVTLSGAQGTVDRAERITGLRTVELRREADAAGRGFALVVNGVPVFAKGANLIPFDSFPARVTKAQMDQVLTSARDANMNMIRVWGGGYYPDDAFFDTADRLGLMVWQDFMFGGAVTPPDRDFRETVRIEAEEQVDRLQAHPSIVLWSGNNEVLSGWARWSDRTAWKKAVGADEQERVGVGMAVLFDRVLRDAAERRDPDAVYWPGSPSTNYEGKPDVDDDGDRHYWDVWAGKKPVEAYLDSCPRFMSEYGLQAMPDMATIRGFAGSGPLTPTSPVMKVHQKFLKGEGNDRLLFYIRANYREPRDFAEFVYLSQVMQADGIELAALHHRACRPVTMGTLYWQINDVWPGASWSSIDYHGRWKALHFHTARFYAPIAAAAERKDGRVALTAISDRTTPVAAEWRLRVMDRDGTARASRQGTVQLAPLAVTPIATMADADVLAGADPTRTFAVYDLIAAGEPASRTIVYFTTAKAMALTDPQVRTRIEPDGAGRYRMTIGAQALARAVWIDFPGVAATLSDNAFDLVPGEAKTVIVTSSVSLATLRRALSIRTLDGVVPRMADRGVRR